MPDSSDSNAEQDSTDAVVPGLAELRPDLFGLGASTKQTAEQPLQWRQQQEEELASAAAVVRAVIAEPIARQHACVSRACLG